MSLFTKVLRPDVTPPKPLKIAVIAVFVVLSLLYISATVLYSLTLCLSKENIEQRFLQTISIIEIVVTILSIIISVIATQISDHFTNASIERVEQIKRQNNPLFNDQNLFYQGELAKKYTRIAQRVKYFVLVPFAFYIGIMVIYYYYVQSTVIQLWTVISGSVSAIFSIILAWVSSVACIVTGKYINLLLDTLYKENKRIFDLYNKLLIDKSHDKGYNSRNF